jgi:hypothetical protein
MVSSETCASELDCAGFDAYFEEVDECPCRAEAMAEVAACSALEWYNDL